MNVTLVYNYSKSTKNTHVYVLATDATQVYYLQKSIFPGEAPKQLNVNITEVGVTEPVAVTAAA